MFAEGNGENNSHVSDALFTRDWSWGEAVKE